MVVSSDRPTRETLTRQDHKQEQIKITGKHLNLRGFKIMSKAPNYDGEYPGAGERIGPLWQKLWDQMEDGGWYRGPDLSKQFAQDVTEACVRGVLYRAALKGVIASRMQKMPRQRNGYKVYKRIDSDVKMTGPATNKIKNVE